MRVALRVAVSLLVATPAAAQPVRVSIPDECAMFADRPDDPEDVRGWINLISLATCMQQPTVPRITEPTEVEPAIEEMAGELAPSVIIYVAALEYGGTEIQLRAAYHIGIASLALVTRARLALDVPAPDDRAATKRFWILQERLETALAPAIDTARVSLGLVVELAEREPALLGDPVTRELVRSATTLLPLLARPEEAPVQVVQSAQR